MIIYKINDHVVIEFRQINEDNLIPYIVKDTTASRIPLLISENEVLIIQEKLSLINFWDFSLEYIYMIVAGCISTVIKQQHA
jgi:hypothetical protein